MSRWVEPPPLGSEAVGTPVGQLRQAFAFTTTPMLIADPLGTVISANPALCQLLQRSEQELVGHQLVEFTHPDDVAVSIARYEELVAEDTGHYELEKRYLTPDGQVVWTRLSVAAVRAAGADRPELFVASLEDIGPRREAERAARRSAELLRVAGDAASFGGWTYAPATRQQTWSDQVFRIFELPVADEPPAVDEVLARYLDADRPRLVAALERCHESGDPFDLECGITTFRGGRRTIRAAGHRRVDDDGEVSIVGSFQDVTARRQLEQQLLRAQRMESIGALAGGIAHDLNNVLAPVVMAADLLAYHDLTPEQSELLHTISISSRRAADMVRQVLTFARGVGPGYVTVAAEVLLDDLQQLARDTLPKSIEWSIDVAPGTWDLVADRTQVEQVLLNLTVNARDAMPEGGRLTVEVANRVVDEAFAATHDDAVVGNFVAISVCDTGVGMDLATLGQMFEPFFTTKAGHGGTGLGLPTSLAIVRSHGGFVTVDSDPGAGTRFTVHLPAAEAVALPEVATVDGPPRRGRGELILVVDDEAVVRTITRQALEAFGYRVELATDGAEAVSVFARRQAEFAAVVTDLMMPVMDGATAIRAMRRIRPDLPIVATSGVAEPAETEQGHGADAFLAKPYRADALVTVVGEVLEAAR